MRAFPKPGRLAGSLDAAGQAVSGRLGEVAQVFFHAGVELSEEWLGAAMDLAAGRPGGLLALGRRAADTLEATLPGDSGRLARAEARRKLDVFWEVRSARRGLGGRARRVDLESCLERLMAEERGEDGLILFFSLEGLGHAVMRGELEWSPRPPRGLLAAGPWVSRLDEGALAALHAGLGLAAAEHVASRLWANDPEARFAASVDRFTELCRGNAFDPRHAEVALETLGLVVRVFFPQLTSGFLSALGARPRLRRLFWHGMGRAYYFKAGQLVPGYGSLRRGVEQARREAGGGRAEHDALAGLGYAFLMVNAADPELVAERLRSTWPDLEGSGFFVGVAGALAMQRLLGEDERVETLLRRGGERIDPELWRRLVVEPDLELRRAGPNDPLYGALPWGSR